MRRDRQEERGGETDKKSEEGETDKKSDMRDKSEVIETYKKSEERWTRLLEGFFKQSFLI